MTIVLVGPPASGKTTIGRRLAIALDKPFLDVDLIIEQRSGMTIAEMFIDPGEAHFRELEHQVTAELLGGDGVLSLGGGAVLDPRTREALKDHQVIWLQVSVTHATRRVGMNQLRPLLLGDVRANLEKLHAEREPLYREVATITLDTTDRRPADLVAGIIDQLPAAPAIGQEA